MTTSTELERHVGGPAGGTLALAPEAWSLAQRIARTEFVPDALRGKAEAVLACILAGAEVGVSPMQALSKIHVIKGRPAMAAELMRAIVLREGHELWIEEQSSERVILGGKRKGSERETRVTWTIDQARRAKLLGNPSWQGYPEAMLLARATAALCRAIFPDVLAGISYTIEELEDADFEEAPPLVAAAGAPARPAAPAPAKRTAQARKAATRGSSAPAETEPPPEPRAEHEEAPLPGEDDDEILDAEIVDEFEVGDSDPGAPPIDPDDPGTYEGPDQNLEGRAYSGPQIIAIRTQELGISDRAEKLELCSKIIGRTVESSKDLSREEVTLVLETMAADGFDARAFLGQETGESAPSGPPRRRRAAEPAPAAPAPSRGPVGTWKADDWRGFLSERRVKVTELLKEAARLARESELPAPANLDEIIGHELEVVLVGYVEDLALERGTVQ